MAKIHEEVVLIKMSKLVRDQDSTAQGTLANNDTLQALEAVVQELAGSDVIVEIVRAE